MLRCNFAEVENRFHFCWRQLSSYYNRQQHGQSAQFISGFPFNAVDLNTTIKHMNFRIWSSVSKKKVRFVKRCPFRVACLLTQPRFCASNVMQTCHTVIAQFFHASSDCAPIVRYNYALPQCYNTFYVILYCFVNILIARSLFVAIIVNN